jgi:hypothetical protein
MARLHVHTGLKVRLQLRFTELVNLLDEMTNVAKENIKYISLEISQLPDAKFRQAT